MTVKAYLLSVPERVLRAAVGLGAGEGVRWLSASALVGATRTGQIFASALLDHYKQTLSEIREIGYFTYAGRQLRPYVVAAAGQFSPKRRSLTERLLTKIADLKR